MKRNLFVAAIIAIVCFAAFLRFYRYENRWGLAYDQAHDALVGRYALQEHKIPLVGPFSSAGPFQTGGQWYWFIMLATAIHPSFIMTPWVVLTSLSVFFIFCLIFFGKEYGGRRFGLFLGLFGAISTGQIAQSVNLTNQTPLAFLSFLSLWSSFRYIKTAKPVYMGMLGFFIFTAACIHLQGIALIAILFSTIGFRVIQRKIYFRDIMFLCAGIFLAVLPLFFYDLSHNFSNSRNMFYYYLHDQYRISLDVLGRRWLTYLTVFLPGIWSHVIGGVPFIGGILAMLFFFMTGLKFLQKKLSQEYIVFVSSFIFMLVIVRYTRTPLYQSFVVFLHPFILIASAWIVYEIVKKQAFAGVCVAVVIVFFTTVSSFKHIYGETNLSYITVKEWQKNLYKAYPKDSFALYDYKNNSAALTMSLGLLLDADGRIKDTGTKIGIGLLPKTNEDIWPSFALGSSKSGGRDLSASTEAQLKEYGFSFLNPSEVYHQTEDWQ